MNLRIFRNQLPRHDSNIPGCSKMFRRLRQTTAVHKVRACHSKSLCPLIHTLDKCSLRTRYVFRHSYRCIVAGGNDNALDQCFYRLNFPLLQKHLGTTHGFCVSTGHHLIIQPYFSCIDGIKDQNQRHNLGNAGRTSPLIRILFVNDLSCRSLHQDRAGRLNL